MGVCVSFHILLPEHPSTTACCSSTWPVIDGTAPDTLAAAGTASINTHRCGERGPAPDEHAVLNSAAYSQNRGG